jgi:hypothetical protein
MALDLGTLCPVRQRQIVLTFTPVWRASSVAVKSVWSSFRWNGVLLRAACIIYASEVYAHETVHCKGDPEWLALPLQ